MQIRKAKFNQLQGNFYCCVTQHCQKRTKETSLRRAKLAGSLLRVSSGSLSPWEDVSHQDCKDSVQVLLSISLDNWMMNKQSGHLRCNISLDIISKAGGEDWNSKSGRQVGKKGLKTEYNFIKKRTRCYTSSGIINSSCLEWGTAH